MKKISFVKILGFAFGIAAVLDVQQKGAGYKMLPPAAQKWATKIFNK